MVLLRSKDIARTVANKLEKGTNLAACPPELVITRPRAHLHPKSKLIHFAKSSAVPTSCMLMSGWFEFSLQSPAQPKRAKRRLTGTSRGQGMKKKNIEDRDAGAGRLLSAGRHASG